MPALEDSAVACFAQGTEGNLTACVVDGFFAAGPSPALMGFLLAGMLLTSLYIAGDGDVTVPAVATVLLGSVLVPLLPPQYVTLAYSVVAIGGTAAAFAAWRAYTSPGGF